MLTDMEKCTIYRRSGGTVTIKCRLGLWEVSGHCGLKVTGEAYNYFEQYNFDGEYSEILGGQSVVEKMLAGGVEG